jgi:ferredoxin
MNIKQTNLVYFSPTGTTKTILVEISKGIKTGTVEHYDLTLPSAEKKPAITFGDELAIFGIPVYGGRIPETAVERLRRFKGQNTPAVVVAVYGNREFEDALLELKDIVVGAGFKPFASGAFIGEHSFSDEQTPIAAGRPDTADAEKAKSFGANIRELIESIVDPESVGIVEIPGAYPYKERGEKRAVSPETLAEVCTTCGACARVCPTGAITVTDTVVTDAGKCILCCACVKECPTGARFMDNPDIQKVALRLHTDFGKRKEPEIFIGG